MNTTCKQISFISEEQKQDTWRNTLRLRERLMTEHGFETFDDMDILTTVLSYAKGSSDELAVAHRTTGLSPPEEELLSVLEAEELSET